MLPVVAIFARVPPGTLLDQLGSGVARDALVVTLKTSAIAQALVLAFGTPLAWLLATRRFRGRGLLVTLVELPIVLPPAVAGHRAAGGARPHRRCCTRASRSRRARSSRAVAFVAGPLYVRQAIASFEGLDPNLLAASRTLGAGPGRTFFRVALPLASGGLAAGFALSVARGLGEFGATIMFAGQPPGRDADAVPRRLLGVRPQLRHRARDRRPARRSSASRSCSPSSCSRIGRSHPRPPASSPLLRPRGSARGRRRGRARRPVRRGQDERAALDRRARAAGARADRARQAGLARQRARRRLPPERALGRARVPGLRALPAPLACAGTSPTARAAARRAARALRDRAPRRRAAGRALGRRAPAGRARPGARARARTSCSSTSRSPPSTPTRGRRCAPSSRRSCASSASPRCS